ncbi:hypothetical protein FMM08_19800 [Quadrisphaera setariae]|uniref:Uncharacterized protein n=1 Tax=Quadrisphaera setariae TaxID=2593304 RepID=A0A5C8Z5N4_9ACTN|nr:hypothetical protein FHN55_18500 [Streptomyces sp. NP160]TXR52441.1 hypothetical protein FMM08_19800 [Quadrisphaera setariae]
MAAGPRRRRRYRGLRPGQGPSRLSHPRPRRPRPRRRARRCWRFPRSGVDEGRTGPPHRGTARTHW